jgi:hypothetical protein
MPDFGSRQRPLTVQLWWVALCATFIMFFVPAVPKLVWVLVDCALFASVATNAGDLAFWTSPDVEARKKGGDDLRRSVVLWRVAAAILAVGLLAASIALVLK